MVGAPASRKPIKSAPSAAWRAEYESARIHEREHEAAARRTEGAADALNEALERLRQAIPEGEGELLDAWNAFVDAYNTLLSAQQGLSETEGIWRSELIELLNAASPPSR